MAKFLSDIAGIRYRPISAQVRVAQLTFGERLYLEPEPTNDHDPNAVRILTEDRVFVGYVQRKFSEAVAEAIAAGDPILAVSNHSGLTILIGDEDIQKHLADPPRDESLASMDDDEVPF